VLVLEDFDLRVYAQRPSPDDEDTPDVTGLRAQRALVAPSILRTTLEQAFVRRGRTVTREPAAYTTIDHRDHEERFDAADEVWHDCRQCGEGYDQDRNACTNLLTRYRERGRATDVPGDARGDVTSKKVSGSRYDRRKKRAVEARGGPITG
jgi:hypothetical protein